MNTQAPSSPPATCTDCGHPLEPEPRTPCPKCGSERRTHHATLAYRQLGRALDTHPVVLATPPGLPRARVCVRCRAAGSDAGQRNRAWTVTKWRSATAGGSTGRIGDCALALVHTPASGYGSPRTRFVNGNTAAPAEREQRQRGPEWQHGPCQQRWEPGACHGLPNGWR